MDLSSAQYCRQLAVTFRGFATIVSAIPSLVFLLPRNKEDQVLELNVWMLHPRALTDSWTACSNSGWYSHLYNEIVYRHSFDTTNYVKEKPSSWQSEESWLLMEFISDRWRIRGESAALKSVTRSRFESRSIRCTAMFDRCLNNKDERLWVCMYVCMYVYIHIICCRLSYPETCRTR
jgi:hypothetical protein